MDPRLIGGKWHSDRGNSNPASFFRFTETTYGIATNGEKTIILTPAFAENGKILDINTRTVLLHYEFIEAAFYEDALAAAIASGNNSEVYELYIKIQAAKSGNKVKFAIPGSLESFVWTRWENVINNPNAEIPSFFHGTWYRIIWGGSPGRGLRTRLEKIIIDETSLVSFGCDHYVSEPVDVFYISDSFSVIFNSAVEYEMSS